jgi:hypothetical protein
MPRRVLSFVAIAVLALASSASAQQKSYRIPDADLKQQILWGATCEGPDGFWLAFGGEDQVSDVVPRTRVKVDGKWMSLKDSLMDEGGRRYSALLKMESARPLDSVLEQHRNRMSQIRTAYFRGNDLRDVSEPPVDFRKLVDRLGEQLERQKSRGDANGMARTAAATWMLTAILQRKSGDLLANGKREDALRAMAADQIGLEEANDLLDVEPAPRLVSPLVYDAKTKLFVLFGGDHGDYLTNDTWTFDPAKKQWTHRNPKTAPAPRGNHTLKANGDGTVTLSSGHYYTSSTDYIGGQYKQFADGDWIYDIAADTWKGPAAGETPDIRVYRKGPYVPEFFGTGPAPDPKATAKTLAELPANRWIPMNDPHQPRMERTWGHAVLDPDGDRVLVFGGGHSAHGGSDVLHFHLSTGRWELPFAVEFPLGQLYSNTSYPEGFNINRRPWVTGHTYQNYNYDTVTKRLYFAGHHHECYVYDPDKGDWIGRIPKPKGMTYDSCFYTLNLTQTPDGLACWTGHGEMFRLAGKEPAWQPMPTTGVKLPTSAVDYSTYVYDAKRDRFLFFRGDYGKSYSGEITALDRKTAVASKLAPKNLDGFAGRKITEAFDRAVYDPESDLVVFAAYVPGDPATVRRTVAYDCAGERWVTLNLDYAIEGKRALQPRGGGHSCGLMFDARRKLIWGCDTHACRMYVMRFEPKSAKVRAIE